MKSADVRINIIFYEDDLINIGNKVDCVRKREREKEKVRN